VLLLDDQPVKQLRIRPQEIARRAALEQRKLREMISFCYTENCYRAFILDYFGDHKHAAGCGTCGNCTSATKGAAGRGLGEQAVPLAPSSALDGFVRDNVPFALDLERELSEQSRLRQTRERAEAAGAGLSIEVDKGSPWPFDSAEGEDLGLHQAQSINITQARSLTEEERLLARKILACAARMNGRFGKNMLAATLRGSRAKNITQGGLDKLSTYAILSDMTQDELLLYIDALISAGCLAVAGGAYPTVSLTPLGRDVMREEKSVELALPSTAVSDPLGSLNSGKPAVVNNRQVNTVDETYTLYCDGLSIEQISAQRGLTEITVEKHLADCILQGRPFDLSRHVAEPDRAQIEIAIDQLGTQLLKPLRDALPSHINYRMIRFVVAQTQRAEQSEREQL
jgi:ATP-dependent DNA helicase RecQ